MSVKFKVGSFYYISTDKTNSYQLSNIYNPIGDSYYIYFINEGMYPFYKPVVTDIKYDINNNIIEMTLDTDKFTEALSTPPATGPKIYQQNGQIIFKDSDLKATTSSERLANLQKMLSMGFLTQEQYRKALFGETDYTSLDRVYGRWKSCAHEWVTTVGFSSEYTDCSKCGAKKEEV